MKKIMFVMMAIVAMSFASCGDKCANNQDSKDSTSVVADSVNADSVIIDSVAVDSMKA